MILNSCHSCLRCVFSFYPFVPFFVLFTYSEVLSFFLLQGVKGESGKCLSSKFGRNNACTITNDALAESPWS